MLNGIVVTFAIDLLPRRGSRRRARRDRGDDRRRRRDHRASTPCWRSTRTKPGTATSSAARPAAASQVSESDVPGVLFLEIDGLAHDVLWRAISDGNAPTLAGWLRRDSHRLKRWETDWSSQTGACQAGLLHGSNEDMPAFRWWEKDRGAAIVTNHPRDAEEIERRHSDGAGCSHADGASRANILSGDAPHSMLTMSTALRRRRPIGRDYAAYFARPYAVARTFVLSLADIGRERRAARSQVRDDVRPRIARSRSYALRPRLGDGRPARPPGRDRDRRRPRRPPRHLHDLPRLRRGRPPLRHRARTTRSPSSTTSTARSPASPAACADAPAPLPARRPLRPRPVAGGNLPRPLRPDARGPGALAPAEPDSVVASESGDDDALSYLSAGLTEVARDDTIAARTVRAATRDRLADGAVALDSDSRREVAETHDGGELPELSVMASGCLGLITFPREPGRVSLRADGSALSAADPGPATTTPGSASSWSAPSGRARWRSAPGVRASSTPTGSRARIRWRRSVRTPPTTCAAPTASPTAPT